MFHVLLLSFLLLLQATLSVYLLSATENSKNMKPCITKNGCLLKFGTYEEFCFSFRLDFNYFAICDESELDTLCSDVSAN